LVYAAFTESYVTAYAEPPPQETLFLRTTRFAGDGRTRRAVEAAECSCHGAMFVMARFGFERVRM
jgi:hypothetical protein